MADKELDPFEEIEVTVTLKGRRECFEHAGLLTKEGRKEWAESAYYRLVHIPFHDEIRRSDPRFRPDIGSLDL